jgi:hypothetical protein
MARVSSNSRASSYAFSTHAGFVHTSGRSQAGNGSDGRTKLLYSLEQKFKIIDVGKPHQDGARAALAAPTEFALAEGHGIASAAVLPAPTSARTVTVGGATWIIIDFVESMK